MADLSLVADSVRDNPSCFERAMQRYLYAFNRLHTEADDSDEMSGLLTDALCQAEDAVMFEPASNIAELRAKADIIWCDVDSLPKDRHVLAFFDDLIRLTGNAVSPVFDAGRWLARFERCGGGWVVQDGKAWLMWPENDRIEDCLAELKMRGGKPAVIELIHASHAAKGAA
ncbi:hypothetical protein [Novosphingobium sp. B1]|uniref:hypothetical protein n=1 Tax=Novosphingobium sp. B1 TaxID=1938756 RepID=UPI0009D854DB|nr:hypothetical protein [Novosphingobium sp. B1]SMC76005.1 hypothetical protein SAMN06272759_106324 [Novosphingobium sp. B1]